MAAALKKKAATGAGANYNSYIPTQEVRYAAQGKWNFIFSNLGVAVHAKPTAHTSCMGCGGKDRFRFMEGWENSGKWYCSGGGRPNSGDGFSLLMHVHGWSFSEALKAVADLLGLAEMDVNERKQIKEASQKAQERLQREAMQRTYQAHQDSYLLDRIFDLELATKERLGRKSLEHSTYELFSAARLYGALVTSFPQLREVA